MCSLAASSFCVQGGETYDRAGARPGLRSQRGHLSAAPGQLPRLPPAGSRPMSGQAPGLIGPIQRMSPAAGRPEPAPAASRQDRGCYRRGAHRRVPRGPGVGVIPGRPPLSVAARGRRAIASGDGHPDSKRAAARYPAGAGRAGSGSLARPGRTREIRVLEAVTAPGISGAVAGTRVRVWLNRRGQPVAPPPGRAFMMVGAVLDGARGGRGHRCGLAHRVLAVPPGTRPAAPGRVGVRVGPDRPAVDQPALNGPAPQFIQPALFRQRRREIHPNWLRFPISAGKCVV